MYIDLNDSAQFTLENFRQLVGSADDSVANQLRIDRLGKLWVSQTVGHDELGGVAIYFETCSPLTGYFGEGAALDDDYIQRLFIAVQANFNECRYADQVYIDVW